MKVRTLLNFLLALASIQLTILASACVPAQELRASTFEAFGQLPAPKAAIDPREIDYPLLAEAIFHQTNLRRSQHGLQPLTHLTPLDGAACLHAEAMVVNDFFSHRNPAAGSSATPLLRVRQQGLDPRYVAENIGEVFAVHYSSGERVYVREDAGGRTIYSREAGGDPLAPRSYLEVAVAVVDSWMASPGHRRNILAQPPTHFGAGCELVSTAPMPMLSCVQLFYTPRRGG